MMRAQIARPRSDSDAQPLQGGQAAELNLRIKLGAILLNCRMSAWLQGRRYQRAYLKTNKSTYSVVFQNNIKIKVGSASTDELSVFPGRILLDHSVKGQKRSAALSLSPSFHSSRRRRRRSLLRAISQTVHGAVSQAQPVQSRRRR